MPEFRDGVSGHQALQQPIEALLRKPGGSQGMEGRFRNGKRRHAVTEIGESIQQGDGKRVLSRLARDSGPIDGFPPEQQAQVLLPRGGECPAMDDGIGGQMDQEIVGGRE